jgi:DNA mismatch repair protein MutS
MAGMPPSLIERANEILKLLESKHVNEEPGDTVRKLSAPKIQLSIFDAHSQVFENIREALADLDINRLTPVEALLKLQEIKKKIQ